MLFNNLLFITHWLEQHMLTCPSVKYLHLQCPGCGMQRSFMALLKGNVAESLKFYPALVPILLLLTVLLLHLRFQPTWGKKIILALQVIAVSLITIQYIYKIATHQIFYST